MSGTVSISKGRSADLRTVDFLEFAEALRVDSAFPEVSRKTLQSLDEFGMNMICADDLTAMELSDFGRLVERAREKLGGKAAGLDEFFSKLNNLIVTDIRLAES